METTNRFSDLSNVIDFSGLGEDPNLSYNQDENKNQNIFNDDSMIHENPNIKEEDYPKIAKHEQLMQNNNFNAEKNHDHQLN